STGTTSTYTRLSETSRTQPISTSSKDGSSVTYSASTCTKTSEPPATPHHGQHYALEHHSWTPPTRSTPASPPASTTMSCSTTAPTPDGSSPPSTPGSSYAPTDPTRKNWTRSPTLPTPSPKACPHAGTEKLWGPSVPSTAALGRTSGTLRSPSTRMATPKSRCPRGPQSTPSRMYSGLSPAPCSPSSTRAPPTRKRLDRPCSSNQKIHLALNQT